MTTDVVVGTGVGEEPRRGRASGWIADFRGWDRATRIGLAAIAAIALVSLLGPLVIPQDALTVDARAKLEPPSWSHPFGTDELGRDILARLLEGGRLTLLTAVAAVLIGGVPGVALGAIAGYYGRWVDAILTRLMDFMLSIPAVLLAIVIIAVLGPRPTSALLAVGLVSLPQFARIARAGVLSLKEREYVLAAISVGARDMRVLGRTIVPNTLGPIVVQCAITAATAILLEAALSFIGLGAQPPSPSWGLMLSIAQGYLAQAPWYGIFPGLAVTVTVLALDSVARGLGRQLTVG
jgi:peptide/nickel transport system permease protein